MGDLITVDFINKRVRGACIATFMDILQSNLSPEDYLDFIEAINDPKFAETLDPDLNYLVNQYWNLLLRDQK